VKPFDQIIIQLGANDIVHFTNLTTAEKELRYLLREAQIAADDVAYTVSGSVGFAPVFWRVLDWLYTRRTRECLQVFARVADELDVAYIDLYRSRENDPFYNNPNTFYSPDLFHPSGEGYGVWYGKCKEQIQCFEYEE
jgi:lysophospholipase L1-like esterase